MFLDGLYTVIIHKRPPDLIWTTCSLCTDLAVSPQRDQQISPGLHARFVQTPFPLLQLHQLQSTRHREPFVHSSLGPGRGDSLPSLLKGFTARMNIRTMSAKHDYIKFILHLQDLLPNNCIFFHTVMLWTKNFRRLVLLFSFSYQW